MEETAEKGDSSLKLNESHGEADGHSSHKRVNFSTSEHGDSKASSLHKQDSTRGSHHGQNNSHHSQRNSHHGETSSHHSQSNSHHGETNSHHSQSNSHHDCYARYIRTDSEIVKKAREVELGQFKPVIFHFHHVNFYFFSPCIRKLPLSCTLYFG